MLGQCTPQAMLAECAPALKGQWPVIPTIDTRTSPPQSPVGVYARRKCATMRRAVHMDKVSGEAVEEALQEVNNIMRDAKKI